MRNCAECDHAYVLNSADIRCFVARKNVGGLGMLLGQQVRKLQIEAPDWCPKKED